MAPWEPKKGLPLTWIVFTFLALHDLYSEPFGPCWHIWCVPMTKINLDLWAQNVACWNCIETCVNRHSTMRTAQNHKMLPKIHWWKLFCFTKNAEYHPPRNILSCIQNDLGISSIWSHPKWDTVHHFYLSHHITKNSGIHVYDMNARYIDSIQ